MGPDQWGALALAAVCLVVVGLLLAAGLSRSADRCQPGPDALCGWCGKRPVVPGEQACAWCVPDGSVR